MERRMCNVLYNFIVISYSIIITIILYQMLCSVAIPDSSNEYLINSNGYLRGLPYRKTSDISETFTPYNSEYDDNSDLEKYKDIIAMNDHKYEIYSPVKVCYVNIYKSFHLNSTMYDYTKEYENFIDNEFNSNKLYFVLPDTNLVYYIENQKCVYYPTIFNDKEKMYNQ
jgi:hypothetical protein